MDYYMNQTYYDILGLPKYGKKENGEEVSLESITNAYRREKFDGQRYWDQKLDKAYSVLSDPKKRREYDDQLAKEGISSLGSDSEVSTIEETPNVEKVEENPIIEELDTETIYETSTPVNQFTQLLNLTGFNNHYIEVEENQISEDEELNVAEEEVNDIPNTSDEGPILVEETPEEFLPPINEVPVPVVEETEQEIGEPLIETMIEAVEEPIAQAEDNLALSKLKKIGKNVVLAVPTAILATLNIISELNNRKQYTLVEEDTEKTITEVKTPESELIEEYRKKLDEKTDKLLDEYHTNYDLEIDKLRYENYIELLNKRIQLKQNENVKRGKLTIYKLQLTALNRQLEKFEMSLEKVNNRIQKKQKLSKIYDNLVVVDSKIEENKNRPIALKKFEAKKENLLNKKKMKISKMKSNREIYAIFKDSFTSAHAVTENFVDNLFVPLEEIDSKIERIYH